MKLSLIIQNLSRKTFAFVYFVATDLSCVDAIAQARIDFTCSADISATAFRSYIPLETRIGNVICSMFFSIFLWLWQYIIIIAISLSVQFCNVSDTL